jgi:hypothetical protein
VHQASAKKIPQRIGVIRKHDLGHLRLRIAYRTRCKTVVRVLMAVSRILDTHVSLLNTHVSLDVLQWGKFL